MTLVERFVGYHLRAVLRASAFTAWWWLTVAVGGTVLAVAASRIGLADFRAAGPGLWVAVGLVLLGELRPVVSSSRTDPAGINLATAFFFAALLRWGFDTAVVVVALATLVGEAGRRKPAYKATFNVAQYVLSYLAAWAVLVLGGWEAAPGAPATLAPSELWLVLLAAVAYHLTNLVVVGTAIGLGDRRGWWASVVEDVAWHTLTTGAGVARAPLVVVVVAAHAGFLPLLVLPLFLLWSTANDALDRERAAATDPLTGLANRARFAEMLEERLATDPDVPLAVCLIDLDRFKEVNDTLGHATGDALLCAVAGRLAAALRERDCVARIGGDEFVLLLHDVDRDTAVDIVDRIARQAEDPYDVVGVRLEVELSVGIALVREVGGMLGRLLRCADAAMYEAKSAGEVVRVYHPDLDVATTSSVALLAELRRAVGHDELELHYQPQVALPGGEILGVEALLRWRHPRHGLLLPCAFLPAARRTSTMRLVTSVVLDLALRQQVVWRAAGVDVPISINASPHDLADVGFVDRVRDGLREHGLPASSLRVEITEDALVGDPERVLATLRALDAVGIGLSLDDFGTGQSSLTRLKRTPISEVKLDRSLIVDLDGASPADLAIVQSVIQLTSALGVRSLAEGVETASQLEALASLGCDAIQGWCIARAMPAAAATEWLQARGGLAAGSATGVVTVGR